MFTNNDLKFLDAPTPQPKILVVGDVMLDRYWFGQVKRISPEAPVPIAKINKIEDRPGGAANVARNIAALSGTVSLLSVLGNDNNAQILKELLTLTQVNFIYKIDPSIDTIIKLRVIAKNQQLMRIDFEKEPSHEILAEILDIYKTIIKEYALVVLSDYGKGGLMHTTLMINLAREYNIPVIIDPKGKNYNKYQNADLITPNTLELQDVVGLWNDEKELALKVHQLKNTLNIKHLLVTRSEEGMSLFSKQDSHYPTLAQEVYDVSGAGDTVIATLALMLAHGAPITLATQVANLAAGIVVAKLGTATVSLAELKTNMVKLIKDH